jgi:hypothetical protein
MIKALCNEVDATNLHVGELSFELREAEIELEHINGGHGVWPMSSCSVSVSDDRQHYEQINAKHPPRSLFAS